MLKSAIQFHHYHFEANGYTFRGSKSAIFILFPFSLGVNSKYKNLLLGKHGVK